MKQKPKMKKSTLHFFWVMISVCLLLPVGLTACSSDDENVIPEEKGIIADFFAKTFPKEQEGAGTDVKEVPFSGFDNQENVCIVINSYDELKSVYQGKEQLPEVDFSKHSLVIGRAWLNVGKKYQDLMVEQKDSYTFITLRFTNLSDAASTVMSYYYFWDLVPKFVPQTIVTTINGSTSLLPVTVISEEVKSFFEAELPVASLSTGFFSDEQNQNVCYMINDDIELSRKYTGKRVLPTIDFSRHTLVIGRVSMPVSHYYVLNQELSVFGTSAQINLYASLLSKDGYWTAVSTLYFWGLYPKFVANSISVKVIEDGIKISDITPIYIAGRKLPYLPKDVSAMPDWLAKQVNEYREMGMSISCGTWNGQPIYSVYVTFMSSYAGLYYDKDGNIMTGGIEYFYEVDDWTCIYYSKIGGELL